MIRLASVAGLALCLGWNAWADANSAPKPTSNATVHPIAVKDALKSFADGHALSIYGLDRVGDEAAPVPGGPRSVSGQLDKLLENYGYIAIWPQPPKHRTDGLPDRVIIITRNGSGQPPGVLATASAAPAPAAAEPAALPPVAGKPQSPLTRQLMSLALQTLPDGGTTSLTPPPQAGGPAVQDNTAPGGSVPMTQSVMASLTQGASQQVKALAMALHRVVPIAR